MNYLVWRSFELAACMHACTEPDLLVIVMGLMRVCCDREHAQELEQATDSAFHAASADDVARLSHELVRVLH
jgi:hypothetical protein